jgi:hypothetical protein
MLKTFVRMSSNIHNIPRCYKYIVKKLQLLEKWLHTFRCHCCVQRYAFAIMKNKFQINGNIGDLNKIIKFLL